MKRAVSIVRELKIHIALVQCFIEGGRLLKETSTKPWGPGVLAKNSFYLFQEQGYHWKGHLKRSGMVQISAS